MSLENDNSVTNPQTFSVRIDITDAGRKLTFTETGDDETKQMFLRALRRLSQRVGEADFLEEPKYQLDMVGNQEATITMSKEDLENILFEILML